MVNEIVECAMLKCRTSKISCRIRSTQTRVSKGFNGAINTRPVYEACYGCTHWDGGKYPTRIAKAAPPKINRPLATRPYGWFYDETERLGVRPDWNEMTTLQLIWTLRRSGSTYEHTARTLNEKGLRTRYERVWDAVNIRNILHRAKLNMERLGKSLDYILGLKQ